MGKLIQVEQSDLEKVRDALDIAAEHHRKRDESNAALHLAPITRYSPLTSTLEAQRDRVTAILNGPEAG